MSQKEEVTEETVKPHKCHAVLRHAAAYWSLLCSWKIIYPLSNFKNKWDLRTLPSHAFHYSLKSSEVKSLTVISVRCWLARLHLNKAAARTVSMTAMGLLFVLTPPQPSQNKHYGHTPGQTASPSSVMLVSICTNFARPNISLPGRWTHPRIFTLQ